MDEPAVDAVTWSDEAGAAPRRSRRRAWMLGGLFGIALCLVVTTFTGLPGPDAVRRYPIAELRDVSAELQGDCTESHVDPLRSRVVLTHTYLFFDDDDMLPIEGQLVSRGIDPGMVIIDVDESEQCLVNSEF